MVWLLFFIAVAFLSVNGMAYKMSAQRVSTTADIPIIVILPTGILTIVFFIATLITGFCFELAVILPALLSGVSTAITMYFMMRSLKNEGFALTIILVNLSFCIPVFLSVLFLNESVSLWQLIGIFILLFMIIALNIKGDKKNDVNVESNKGGGKTINLNVVWAGIACLFNGLINFGIKIQRFYLPDTGEMSFNFFTYFFCFVCMAIIAVFNIRNMTVKKDSFVKILPASLLLAVSSGTNFYVQLLLPQYVSATIQFTVCCGLTAILSVILGVAIYKERFGIKSVLTLILSLIAIILQVV